MKKEYIISCLLLLTLIGCVGCASIVDGRKKQVRIDSNPPATLTVLDHKGETVIVTNTPAVVRLKRNNGYFVKEQYKLRFEAPGYYPSEVPLNTNLNVWYFGNILFGGVIGFVFVDPATGAMWTIEPPTVNRNLIATTQTLSPEQLQVAEADANPVPKRKPVQTKGHSAVK